MNSIERCVMCRRINIDETGWSFSAGGTMAIDPPRDSLCPDCTQERFPQFYGSENKDSDIKGKKSFTEA